MASQGYDLILVARREGRLGELAEELESAHGIATEVAPADLGTAEGVDGICARIREGDVSVVVANAGFGLKGPHIEQDSGRLREMVRVNCEAPVLLAQAAGESFAREGSGALIVVSSTAAFQGVPYSAAYAATKAFSLIFGEGLQHELKAAGIDVLTLCPGPTRTEGPLKTGVHPDAVRGMMPAAEVVRAALRDLGRKSTSVPGVTNRLGAWLVRWFPRSWAASVSGRIMKKVIQRGRQGSD